MQGKAALPNALKLSSRAGARWGAAKGFLTQANPAITPGTQRYVEDMLEKSGEPRPGAHAGAQKGRGKAFADQAAAAVRTNRNAQVNFKATQEARERVLQIVRRLRSGRRALCSISSRAARPLRRKNCLKYRTIERHRRFFEPAWKNLPRVRGGRLWQTELWELSVHCTARGFRHALGKSPGKQIFATRAAESGRADLWSCSMTKSAFAAKMGRCPHLDNVELAHRTAAIAVGARPR